MYTYARSDFAYVQHKLFLYYSMLARNSYFQYFLINNY
jgi:hypothetical protein